MVSSADLRLRQWLADRSVPVVTRPEALALGYTDSMIRRRLEAGWWKPTDRGVYMVGESHDRWLGDLTRATSKLRAVVSHHSAAELHGFPATPRGLLQVTVPHHKTHTLGGITVYQTTDLLPEHVTELEGLPVTNPARSFFDIAHFHTVAFLVQLAERLAVEEILAVEELEEIVSQLGRRGRRGTTKARKVLEGMLPHVRQLESELERIVLDLIRRAGLPLPLLQYPLPWRTTPAGRVDMAYPQARLIIECDGRRWHATSQAFEEDRRRDNLAVAAGWRVIRVTWTMATEEPELVVSMIRDALAASLTA